jgi:hypothetical protein
MSKIRLISKKDSPKFSKEAEIKLIAPTEGKILFVLSLRTKRLE